MDTHTHEEAWLYGFGSYVQPHNSEMSEWNMMIAYTTVQIVVYHTSQHKNEPTFVLPEKKRKKRYNGQTLKEKTISLLPLGNHK